jgi:hypothetical protein
VKSLEGSQLYLKPKATEVQDGIVFVTAGFKQLFEPILLQAERQNHVDAYKGKCWRNNQQFMVNPTLEPIPVGQALSSVARIPKMPGILCMEGAESLYALAKLCRRHRWMEFANFFADMGEPPTNSHSIDRIDVNKGYYPENCRWATHKEQVRNTRVNRYVEHDGEVKTLAEWAEIFQIPYTTLHGRLRKKLSLSEAISIQPRPKREALIIEWNNECLTLSQWAKKVGIAKHSLWDRIYKRGWSIEKALTTPPRGSSP